MLMVIDLATAASLVVILTFICGIFNYVIIKPLRHAIDNLNKAIADLRVESKERGKILNEYYTRLALTEERINNLHIRVEKLETDD